MKQNGVAPNRFLTVVTKNIFFVIEKMPLRAFFDFLSYSYRKNGANEKNIGKVAKTIEKVVETIGKSFQNSKKCAFFEKSYRKICRSQKIVVPLHPQSRNNVIHTNFSPLDKRKNGAIAQLVEQRTENPCVPGSIPGGTTSSFHLTCLFSSEMGRFFVCTILHHPFISNIPHTVVVSLLSSLGMWREVESRRGRLFFRVIFCSRESVAPSDKKCMDGCEALRTTPC